MKAIHTKHAPAAIGPYSQAIAAGDFIFLSGQLGIDPETGALAENGVTAQAEQACKNIAAILKKAGLSMDAVVKTTCFLATMDDFNAFNDVYAKHFTSKPARSCFAVAALPKDGLCEIEVMALRK
ncbi:MAG: RidA family protein [Dialister sp.]|nr:RidA family protein [Dialister sp.]